MSRSTTRRESLVRMGRLGATTGLLAGLAGCGTLVRALREETRGMASPGPTDARRASLAWAYFQRGRSGTTRLVQAIAGSGFATTGSLADQIAASLCAYRLGVASRADFDSSVSAVLGFLAQAPLAGGTLPGRFYSVSSGALLDPPAPEGDPGWSGIQVGRLLLWLRALADRFEIYRVPVEQIVARWQVCAALDEEGRICEGLPGNPQGLTRRPEVGLGYGLIAAQGYRAWGLAAEAATPVSSDFQVSVEGLDFAISGAGTTRPPLHVVPYALLGLELGWKGLGGSDLEPARAVLARMFAAQERRYARTGIRTARADFKRTSAPYALIGAVVASGTPWATLGEEGAAWPDLALLSTKAAFAMWALGAPSAKDVMDSAETLFETGSGWLEGRYETSGAQEWTRTASTNAVVLEALLYRELGPVIGAMAPAAPAAQGAPGLACPVTP